MSGRLDDEKLETLRSWGTGLAADGRDELRAAGKAILILVEEIERLQVDVWHTRDTGHRAATPESLPTRDATDALEPALGLDTTLRGRVHRFLHTRSVDSP